MKTVIDYTNKLKDYFLALTDDNWDDIRDLIGVKIPKPTITVDEYHYNGQSQGPTIVTEHPEWYEIQNETNIERGTYICTISPTGAYIWADGTSEAIEVEYTIGMGIPDVELSSDSIVLIGASKTITFSNPTGEITSIVSDDTSIASISISDNEITVSRVSEGVTSITFNISASQDGNYSAGTKKIKVNSIVNTSWSSATDLTLQMLLDAHYNDGLDLTNYWNIGDERTVSLSAMAIGAVNETHVAQNVTMVLMNAGGKTLADGKTCAFVVGQKNLFVNGSYTENGYINSSNNNNGGWKYSKRRTWCNDTYYNAIALGFKALLKQFINKSGTGGGSSSGTEETTDWAALPAEVEVFGRTSYSVSGEGSQFKYYETAANRIKKVGDSGAASDWWERSPRINNTYDFCYVNSSGTATANGTSANYGIAPFFCI